MSAVTRLKLKEQQPMQKLIASKVEKADETALGYLWSAYYLAEQELHKEELPHVIGLF